MNTRDELPHAASVRRTFAMGALMVVLLLLGSVLGGRENVWGSKNITFLDEGGTAVALARRAAELNTVEAVSDEELRAIVARMREKAAEGDPRAALFVFELASRQRSARTP
ncbi:MAG: hypothetical protein SFZ24_10855 [Planctomycetota bacterium]|nr:hypothetical protein [Planctomycetota bacterium]